jgi:hypothetical protein
VMFMYINAQIGTFNASKLCTTKYALQSTHYNLMHYNLRTTIYALQSTHCKLCTTICCITCSLPTHYAIHTLHKFKKKFVVKKH